MRESAKGETETAR